jgi:Divergent InlB B-repeat domain
MITSRLFKILVVLAVTSLVTGCKLAVIVNLGGTVQSLSGTRNCAEGTICNINITDVNFSESFTAVAKPGYQFVKWQKGSDFFCGDSTSTTCTVALSGNVALDEAIIA